jgi:23S rRNA (uracil1939-C5)-methyltransferase
MSQTSAADLKYNLPVNGKAVQATTEQYLTEGEGKKRVGADDSLARPDLIVVDPPRSGLGDAAARAVGKVGAPSLTYVSCDPATLARDLIPLQAAGYTVEQLHLVDLFPQTYHLESVVHLVR